MPYKCLQDALALSSLVPSTRLFLPILHISHSPSPLVPSQCKKYYHPLHSVSSNSHEQHLSHIHSLSVADHPNQFVRPLVAKIVAQKSKSLLPHRLDLDVVHTHSHNAISYRSTH